MAAAASLAAVLAGKADEPPLETVAPAEPFEHTAAVAAASLAVALLATSLAAVAELAAAASLAAASLAAVDTAALLAALLAADFSSDPAALAAAVPDLM